MPDHPPKRFSLPFQIPSSRRTVIPRIDPRIDLGHILMFVGFVISGIFAWSKMDNRVSNTEADAKRLEVRIDRLDQKVEPVPVIAEQVRWLVQAQQRTERRSGYEPPPAPPN